MRRGPGFSLSFLDLLCSAMGAMVILSVIYSIIKYPVAIPVKGEIIHVRLVVTNYAGEVGMVVRPPRFDKVAVAAAAGVINAPSRPGEWTARFGLQITRDTPARTNAVFVAEIADPAEGIWELQPLLIDWDSGHQPAPAPSMSIWTRHGRVPDEEADSIDGIQSPTQPHFESFKRWRVRIAP